MQLVFATSNAHKVREAQDILGPQCQLTPLSEMGWQEEIEETEGTLEGNALLKARAIADRLEIDCLSEDTGLEVDALSGAPGVKSARYAGPQCTPSENVQKLLSELRGKEDRTAQFRTVVTLILGGAAYNFTGVVRGKITDTPRGESGFGYDPVFIPEGYDNTFAEMDIAEKSRISHRAMALRKMASFLDTYLRYKSPVSGLSQK